MTLRSLLLTSATLVALAPAVTHAAPTPIGETQPIAQQVPIVQGPGEVRQIRFDDGTIVSFVGEARYTVTGPNSISIESGNVTVLSGSPDFTLNTPSGVISVDGGTALTVTAGSVTSHVFSGTVSVNAGSGIRTFNAGQAWSSDGSVVTRQFAAGPQAVPSVQNLQNGGIYAAALNGLPVALGEALAALGASSDIVAAGQAFDAVAQGGLNSLTLQTLPNDFERLLEFQNEIAARVSSDFTFDGASPAIIDAYLRYLAGGGRIAEFQAVYANLLGSYFEILLQGGFPSDFQGLSPADVQAYLNYLNAVGGLGVLGEAQQALVAEYLAFLADGGVPANFIFSDVTLNEGTIDLYFGFLSDFVAFIRSGGAPSDFTALDQTLLARYIQLLASAGQLQALFGAQADIFEDYADFLANGGNPNDFPGLNDFGLSDELIAEYTSNLQMLLTSLFNGADISDFGIDAATLATQISQLENEGVLSEAFAAQRAILLQFAAFIEAGGTPDNFTGFAALGFSDAVVQSYAAAINSLLALVASGSDISEFTGNFDVLLAYIAQLQAAGQLGDAFTAAQQEALNAFLTFVANGGAAADFDGFLSLGLNDAVVQAYVEAITEFLQFLADGGAIADYQGNLAALIEQIADLQASGQLAGAFDQDVLDALNAYLAFLAEGGVPADFTGFDDIDFGNGGTGSTADGSFEDGPEVSLTTEINPDAPIDFDFRTARGRALVDTGAANGNFRINTRAFNFPRLGSFRDEDGLPSREFLFTVNDLDLVASGRFGDVLLTRHVGPGTAAVGGLGMQLDGTVAIDSVFVQNASSGLPTGGEVVYDLTQTLGVQTVGYEGDATFDMVLGVRFGTLPLVAANAILRADTDYIYSTAGDGVSGLDFSNTNNQPSRPDLGGLLNLVSGQGAFCASGTDCFLFTSFVPNADYTQLGGTIITRSNSADDAMAAATVVLDARDASSVVTEVPDVTPGGMVTAAFGSDRANIVTAEAGASNRTFISTGVFRRTPIAVDMQGLSEINRGLSNVFERGDAAVVDLAGDTEWQIGRWVGLIGDGTIYSPNSGLAYALIPLMDGIPGNGRVEYTLLGATSPVYGDGSTAPGTFDGSAVLVLGASALFGIDATVTMPDATYGFTSTGGLEDPSIRLNFRDQLLDGFASGSQLTTTMTGNGAACPNGIESCQTQVRVGIGGNNAEYASVGYAIYDEARTTAGVSGTAVFGGEIELDEPDTPVAGDVREDQFVIYASNTIGIDSRTPATVTYDEATGAPIAYQWQLNDFTRERERPEIGSASLVESGSAGDVIGWARWADGTSGGRYYDIQTVDLPANSGWHLVSGELATNLPASGTVTYDLIGNTSPTIRDASLAPGTLDSAQAAVAFGTIPRVGVELALTIGGESYSLSSPGGVSDLSQGWQLQQADGGNQLAYFGGNSFQNNIVASGGSLCSGTTANCNALLNGFLAGDGATHMGIAYTLGNTGFDQQIDGSAVFAQSNLAASSEVKLEETPIMSSDWARWSGDQLILPSAVAGQHPTIVGVDGERTLMDELGVRMPDWIEFH